MADAYPWGTQTPSARLTKLQRELEKNTTAKAAQVEAHRAAMEKLTSAEKSLQADIRACETIIQKEEREEQSQQLSKLVSRMAGSGGLDLARLLADPDLEAKLAAIAAQQSSAGEDSKKAKAAKKTDGGTDPQAKAA